MMNKEEQDSLLDNWSEDWTFTSDTTQPTPTGQESPGHIDLDYSSDKSETGLDNALGDKDDKNTKADNFCFDEQKDKTSIHNTCSKENSHSTRNNRPYRESSQHEKNNCNCWMG